jgi:hypothetical protein
MAWRDAIYVQFPDEAQARVTATDLGVDFPASGRIPAGNQNYAMHAPMQSPWESPPVVDEDGVEVTPGIPEPGYWAMLRLNDNFDGYATLVAAIEEAGVRRELTDPPVVWA